MNISEKILNEQAKAQNNEKSEEKSSLDMFLADTSCILEATKRSVET